MAIEKPMHFGEVQKLLGVSNTWLYRELQEGKLKGKKMRGSWIVFPTDLQKYFDGLETNQRRISR